MALISCPRCGGIVSDKAEECPHCGAPAASALNAAPVQSVYAAPYQPKSGRKSKIAVGLGVAAVVLLIVLIAVILIAGSGSDTGASEAGPAKALISSVVQNNNHNGADTQKNTYNVTLRVECEKNKFANQYDLDIFVDGDAIATLAHGETNEYALKLSEGTHKVEFRINGKHSFLTGGGNIYDPDKPETFKVQYMRVSKDTAYSYHAELVANDGLKIQQTD